MAKRPWEAWAPVDITTLSCLMSFGRTFFRFLLLITTVYGAFILLLVTHYNSVWSICRLVAGPPATLCTDRTSIIVDEGVIELCPQGEEVYTAAEALHPGQDITCVKLLEHSTALKLYIGMPVANLAGYLLDSMSTEPSCNVCYTPDSQHVNRFLVVPRHVCCALG